MKGKKKFPLLSAIFHIYCICIVIIYIEQSIYIYHPFIYNLYIIYRRMSSESR